MEWPILVVSQFDRSDTDEGIEKYLLKWFSFRFDSQMLISSPHKSFAFRYVTHATRTPTTPFALDPIFFSIIRLRSVSLPDLSDLPKLIKYSNECAGNFLAPNLTKYSISARDYILVKIIKTSHAAAAVANRTQSRKFDRTQCDGEEKMVRAIRLAGT